MEHHKCIIELCKNDAVQYGLCEIHLHLPLRQHFQTHALRFNTAGKQYMASIAGRFFSSIIFGPGKPGELGKRILPVAKLPFTSGPENDFIYDPRVIDPAKIKIELEPLEGGGVVPLHVYTLSQGELQVRNEIVQAIFRPKMLERPIVFMVVTNQPHTGIYIWLDGHLYSFGYGYSDDVPGPIRRGSIYSIDLLLRTDAEARIVWVGMLTPYIIQRLQEELNKVTQIEFFVEKDDLDGVEVDVVDRETDFIIPDRPYGGFAADTDTMLWNCTKWSMHILFGSEPANFRELVGRDRGIPERFLLYMMRSYQENQVMDFLTILANFNQPFATAQSTAEWAEYLKSLSSRSGGRKRVLNTRNRIKRKFARKTNKTRKSIMRRRTKNTKKN